MTKRKTLAAIIAVLLVSVLFAAAPAYAEKSLDELNDDLKEAQQENKDAKAQYKAAKKKEQALNDKIAGLEKNIAQAEKELEAIQKDINANNKKVDKVQKRVKKLEKEVGSQESSLNSRLRAMYLSGDMSIIEVLLGSRNVVDFLANVDMVRRIHEQDVSTLNELNSKLAEVEAHKKELVEIKRMLNNSKQEQKKKQEQLAGDKQELEVALAEAHEETIAAWDAVEDTQAASEAIESELRNRKSSTTYGGGPMIWPCGGTITSEFGYRIHPITHSRRMHAGIDIGAPTGSPVVAAADGEVIFAGWNSGGYGNLVMIDHGSNVVTAYAHNSAFACSVGQQVRQGELIARVGSTGNSTGPHCHFEVRVNGVPQNPRGWL
ncbi:MAG: peptidoglycan DD-metalloendopeptidase family protein [Clostridiales Family XIII bacterium]|nr:peptidoglycan DD-metalloendopeptidase family protein [Clostridiales Family XIII bacterium]